MQLQILLYLPGAIWPHHPASPAKKKKVSSHIHCSASFVIQALNSSELWPAFVFYQTSIVSRDVQVDLFGMTSGQQGSFILNSVCPFPDAGIICSFVPWVVVALLVKDWNAFNKRVTQTIFFFTLPIIYVYICIYRYFLLMLSGEQKPMNKDILRFWCICIHFAPITSRCLCCRWSKGAIESSERLIIHCSMRHAAPKRHLPTSVSLQKLWEIAN